MKHLFSIVILLFSVSFVFSQTKVVDKSTRKRPKWYAASQTDYLIVSGEGKTLEQAKEQTLNNLFTNILKSVATYVKSESSLHMENTQRDNLVSTFTKYSSQTNFNTADLPFIKGVSLNKAKEYYWEKILNKSTGQVSYEYHVLYPFSKSDLRRLIMEFKKRDDELTEQLETITNGLESIQDVDRALAWIKELDYLISYFPDIRKNKAQAAKKRLVDYINAIEFVAVKNEPGSLEYQLKFRGKIINEFAKPEIKPSSCIKITSYEKNGPNVMLSYTHDLCDKDVPLKITALHTFSDYSVNNDFTVDLTKGMVKIMLKSDIQIIKRGDGFDCTLNLYSKYESPFILDKITLEWKELPQLIFDNLNLEYEGVGNHKIELNNSHLINSVDISKYNSGLIKGVMFYRPKLTGESKRYNIYYQRVVVN